MERCAEIVQIRVLGVTQTKIFKILKIWWITNYESVNYKRRRHKIFTDHIELRLELFFFDELVQLATYSLAYFELHQASAVCYVVTSLH